jgi:Membrane bound beta barrel domain (DUF5777)
MRLVTRFVMGLLVLGLQGANAYEEWDLPDLTAPTSMKPLSLEFQIQHQFADSIFTSESFNRFFGLGDLANVVVGLRADIWSTAQVYASFGNTQTLMLTHWEYVVGGAYAVPIPWLFMNAQIDAQFFSYAALDANNTRTEGGFYDLSLRNDPIFGRVVFLVNAGYDSDQRRYGLGIGADAKVLENFDLYGSYFPKVDKSPHSPTYDNAAAIYNPYCFGIKMTTGGHQFFLFVDNSTEVGVRHLMQGTTDYAPRFGFMIKRLFSFE